MLKAMPVVPEAQDQLRANWSWLNRAEREAHRERTLLGSSSGPVTPMVVIVGSPRHHVRVDARRYALSLPETQEQIHHGMPSFRVRGKIFATMADADHIRVMAGEAVAQSLDFDQ